MDRTRIDHAAARKGQTGLALQPGNFIDDTEPQGMWAISGDRVEYGIDICFGHWSEGYTAMRCHDLNQRLQPVQAARTRPDDFD
jgi:hypothetical protein